MIELKENDLIFAKVKPDAVIPTKENEDAGRDVYACFDEDYIVIGSNETKLIPTGIASAMSPKYEIRLRDRGSNGSKGIHVNAGTIDSGFRGEWFVAWCNTNWFDVILTKLTKEELIENYGEEDEDGYIMIPENPNNITHDFFRDYIVVKNDAMFDGLLKDCAINDRIIYYPYTKAIAQAEVCEVPVMNQYEVSYDELKEIKSLRGTGALGSSGK